MQLLKSAGFKIRKLISESYEKGKHFGVSLSLGEAGGVKNNS